MTSTRVRRALLPAAVLLLAGTTGCAASGLHPGLAARVGSESLSRSSADRLTRDVCTSVKQTARGTPTTYANSTLTTSVVQSWVQRAMAHQLAQQYDVSPSAAYDKTVDQANLQLATLDDGLRAAVIDTYTATPYFVDVLTTIGRDRLVKQGTASPTSTASLDAGIDVAQDWEQTHPIVTAPGIPDLTLGDSSFAQTSTDTSVPVSSFAKAASAATPSQSYLASLPADQVCR